MNRQKEQNIIRETFGSSFDKSGFTGFIKTFLTGLVTLPLPTREITSPWCSWERLFDLNFIKQIDVKSVQCIYS